MSYIKNINRNEIITGMQEKVKELKNQPEYQWQDGRINFETTPEGEPAIKAGVANCPIDHDIWEGLRNPAQIGLYPAGLKQIWELWAENNKKKTDESGRTTIFQLPPSFEEAKKEYSRAVIISVLLPISQKIMGSYNETIQERGVAPEETYCKAVGELNQLLDQAITRFAFDVIDRNRMVMVMNNENVNKISTQTIPKTHQGTSHGVCKGGNYSQKSIAVLTGLGQFGASRLVFRDEIVNEEVKRFVGPYLSLVIFDKEPLVTDGSGKILNINQEWKERALAISDFTNTDPQVNKYRFCTHVSGKDENGCSLCIQSCPSGALANSSPLENGEYPENIKQQNHRFYEGELQFDNGTCCDERGQKANLYNEWVCARCMASCGHLGKRRKSSVENFEKLLFNN